MKNITVLIVLIFISSVTIAQSTLNLYNNTNKDVFAAFVYWDKENTCFTSKGWFKISAYSEKEIPLGRYFGKVFIHGSQSTFWSDYTWGRGYSFCVDPNKAFEIRNAERVSCKKKASFSELEIQKGKNKWTFNP